MFGIILQETVVNIWNLWQFLVPFIGLIIAILTLGFSVHRGFKRDMESKADKTIVVNIQKEMKENEKTAASTEYVDKESRALHHRISNVENHTKEKLDIILGTVNVMNDNINKLLFRDK